MDKYIKARIRLEKRVIRAFAKNVFNAGMTIKVCCNGESEEVGATEFHKKADKEFISDATCADMIDLDVYKDGEIFGTALLVLGNSGYDVICDYHTKLEPWMPSSEEMDKFEATGERIEKLIVR